MVILVLRASYLRVTHPFATKHRSASFDLHVLGTPPAFILSQDQTLQKCIFVLFVSSFFVLQLISQLRYPLRFLLSLFSFQRPISLASLACFIILSFISATVNKFVSLF